MAQEMPTAGGTLDDALVQMAQRIDALTHVAEANSSGIQKLMADMQTLNSNVTKALQHIEYTDKQIARVRRSWNFKIEPTSSKTHNSLVDNVIEEYASRPR